MHAMQRVGLSGAERHDHDLAAGAQTGRRYCETPALAGNFLPAEEQTAVVFQERRAGEKRRGVAIVAHAEKTQIVGAPRTGEDEHGAAIGLGRLGDRPRDHPRMTTIRRHAEGREQLALGVAEVAVGAAEQNVALIAHGEVRALRELGGKGGGLDAPFVERGRRAAAGQRPDETPGARLLLALQGEAQRLGKQLGLGADDNTTVFRGDFAHDKTRTLRAGPDRQKPKS